MNVVDAFLFQARQVPTAAAICAPGTQFGVVSYGRLQYFINNIGRMALSVGLRPGHVVAIFAKDRILHAALLLGLMRLGIVVMSGRLPKLPRECNVDAVLSDAIHPFENAGRVINIDASWTMGDGTPPNDAPVGDGRQHCCYALTSGTTGDVKAVALSHDDILRRIFRYNVVWGNRLPNCSRMFSDLDITTLLGLLFLIYMLSRGGTLFMRGIDAAETMQAFDLYKVQSLVAAPSGLAEFIGYYESSPGFASPFEVIVSVGSLLSKALSDRVRARMCAHVISSYGSTEGHIAAAAPSHQIAHIAGAVGYVAPGVSVEIVDRSDVGLADGREGLVRIRGDYNVEGYVGDPAGSRLHFREGWFYPGDLGTLTADGVLAISGRETAVINLGGDKINPEVVEAVVASCPGVVEAAVLGCPNALGIEEIWALVAVNGPFDAEAIRAYCTGRMAPEWVPVRVLRAAQIPRNPMGKVDRSLLPGLARAG